MTHHARESWLRTRAVYRPLRALSRLLYQLQQSQFHLPEGQQVVKALPGTFIRQRQQPEFIAQAAGGHFHCKPDQNPLPFIGLEL